MRRLKWLMMVASVVLLSLFGMPGTPAPRAQARTSCNCLGLSEGDRTVLGALYEQALADYRQTRQLRADSLGLSPTELERAKERLDEARARVQLLGRFMSCP